MRNPRPLPLLLSALLLSISPTAFGAVVANFTDGTGTASPDQYTGTAGSGWTGAWGKLPGSGSIITATVANTSPLKGGGNYLSMSMNSTSSGNEYLTRTWDSSAVAYTGPLTLSWQFRLDSPLGGFTGITDQVAFADGSGPNLSFFIVAEGATQGNALAQTWAFYNGQRNAGSFDASLFVSTGISLVSGAVYDFSVTLDPSTRSWVGTVSNGVTSFTSGTLGFRTNAFSAVGTFEAGLRSDGVGGAVTGSLDSISIVPEPGAVALGCVASLLICGLHRRRR